MELESLTYHKEGRVGCITLTRPERLNVIDSQFFDDLGAVLDAIEADHDVGAVVVSGNENVFCAGGDIKMMMALESGVAALPLIARSHALYDRLERLAVPVVAALAGMTFGGGCELALACDMRIAADNLQIGLPEISLGTLPGSGGTQRLPRLIGAARAKELMLTGQIIDAAEADRIGLVNRVLSTGDYLDTAMTLAHDLARQAPIASRSIKALVNAGMNTDQQTGMELEKQAFALVFTTRDRAEGMQAFVEKRRPQFTGE